MARDTATPYVDSRCFLGEGIVWWGPRQALLWTDIERSRFWMHDADGARNWKLPKRLASFTPNRSGGLLFALEDGLFRADFDASAPEGLRLAHPCRDRGSGHGGRQQVVLAGSPLPLGDRRDEIVRDEANPRGAVARGAVAGELHASGDQDRV